MDADIKSEPLLRQRALSLQFLLEELDSAKNMLNIVVIDACRDNPFPWGNTRGGTRGLLPVTPLMGSIVVFATEAGKTASDGTGRNGLFTTHLLNNLRVPGIDIHEVFRRTGADVSQASNRDQIPEIFSKFFGVAYLNGTGPAPRPNPAPNPTPAPTPVPSNMVRVNGGTFMMGSPESEAGRDSDEVQRWVTVGSFYMGKYPVTQREYQAVMGTNPSHFKGDNLPVENVSWYDAIEYCNRLSQKEGLTPAYTIDKSRSDPNNRSEYDKVRWVVTWNRSANGYRLPTEAEWEYACRAGTTTPYNVGNSISSSLANFNSSNVGRTTPVGMYAPNPWALYDMHGNVWEWNWDWYGSYSTSDLNNPVGPTSGTSRVIRGGGWDNSAVDVRSASRNVSTPSSRSSFIGFRLVRL